MQRRRSLALGAVSLLALGGTVAACGSDKAPTAAEAGKAATTTTAPPASSGAGGGTITIKDFKFSPNPLTAKVGDTITIANTDGTQHTVTAKDRSFDTGRFADGTKTITVTKAGKVEFFCNVHNYMTGVIQVSA